MHEYNFKKTNTSKEKLAKGNSQRGNAVRKLGAGAGFKVINNQIRCH